MVILIAHSKQVTERLIAFLTARLLNVSHQASENRNPRDNSDFDVFLNSSPFPLQSPFASYIVAQMLCRRWFAFFLVTVDVMHFILLLNINKRNPRDLSRPRARGERLNCLLFDTKNRNQSV